MSNIRISQLNELINPIESTDFIALVESSSLTTYRTNIQSIGTWMAASGSSSSSLVSISSSWAPMPVLNNSSSWASSSLISISSSWASSSISSSYSLSSSWARHTPSASIATSASNALRSITSSFVDLDPTVYLENSGSGYLSLWKSSGPYSRSINSYLTNNRNLFISNNQLWCGWFGGPANPNWSASIYDGTQWAGFLTNGSVISDLFMGHDHKEWAIYTGSLCPSGSYSSNNTITIPLTSTGLSESLEGKWLRIAAADSCSNAEGFSGIGIRGLNGRISMRFVTSTEGSNVDETIDLEIHGSRAVSYYNVFVSNGQRYNGGIIETIRIGHGWDSGSVARVDPFYYIDVKIKGLIENDTQLVFKGFSHAGSGIAFMARPTIDVPDPHPPIEAIPPVTWIPWIHVNPKATGFYSNIGTSSIDYENRHFFAFQGRRVGIGPLDYWKSSFDRIPKYELDVSGSINSLDYYASGSKGVTQNNILVSIAGVPKTLSFKNGLLVSVT